MSDLDALGPAVGLMAAPLNGGTPLLEQGADRPLQVGSAMKLFTAAAALAALGHDHRVVTEVKAAADGVTLVGAGDALLSPADLASLARKVPRTGRPIKVHVDDVLFGQAELAPGWGAQLVPTQVPLVRSLTIDRSRDTDTAAAAGSMFARALTSVGVSATYAGRQRAGGALVARTAGHTVGELVRAMLTRSDAAIAETLFRLTAMASGDATSWSGAAEAQRRQLEAFRISGVRQVDGSGLSDADRATAAAVIALLRLASSDSRFADLVAGLPVAGRTGTLAGRFVGAACAIGKVHAKTGTLASAVALAGYTTRGDGSRAAFAVIVNQWPSSVSLVEVRTAVDHVAAVVTGC